ncbi:unnamed protein product [Schistosoma mattheei]|uniref:Uncharacterized protein n=1 Tax=Schistosoma mattheei TaxID=31246 RepID=A0A183P7Y4_9TREM|nr:unnamed protein product [Schistosoma mattheei]
MFKQLFLSKLPQQMQAVLISFQNNALDELAASANPILEITISPNAEDFSVKEKPQTAQNDITELNHTRNFVTTVNDHTPLEETPHIGDLSLDLERLITLAGAGIITSTKVLQKQQKTLQFSQLKIDRHEK